MESSDLAKRLQILGGRKLKVLSFRGQSLKSFLPSLDQGECFSRWLVPCTSFLSPGTSAPLAPCGLPGGRESSSVQSPFQLSRHKLDTCRVCLPTEDPFHGSPSGPLKSISRLEFGRQSKWGRWVWMMVPKWVRTIPLLKWKWWKMGTSSRVKHSKKNDLFQSHSHHPFSSSNVFL